MNTDITAHMVVKNEDQWVSRAIQSVLPYVDTFLITDTGSSDNTINLVNSIKSPKIVFNQTKIKARSDMAKIRTLHIKLTHTPWIWIVDGDEIYPESLVREIITATKDSNYQAVVVRRYDLLGDVYHRQVESVGSYSMFGETGHLLIRLINRSKLKDLEVKGEYPLESYYSGKTCVNDLPKERVYITKLSLFHAMYLKRSSLGGNLPMFNRSKYKIETGIKIDGEIPKSLLGLPKRSFLYELVAHIVTPIKNLKRKLL
ncbi:glycosyltransferase [Candidatus Woesebacteria bacterium]|nr:glycosyltransferase [Candidatus Woesebacteria bacterium]